MPSEPPINFAIHQSRAGAGAHMDFEQMLGLLVGVTDGTANLVFANPGDWGIDVLVGDLNGRTTIWQAKYFMPGVLKKHEEQITTSFASAMKSAAAKGYTVARWVLCVPSSMDAPTLQWWQGWKARKETEYRLVIDLWDENELRRRLLAPAASGVRREYYHPYRSEVPEQPVAPAITVATDDPPRWEGGTDYRIGGGIYLLHDGLTERTAVDRSWVWREATADRLDPGSGRVRVRELLVLRRTPAAEERRSALGAQATLLKRLNGRAGLPRLIDTWARADGFTLVAAHPPGRRWSDVFGPGSVPPDRLTAAELLTGAAGLCTGLAALHGLGECHAALRPAAILVDPQRRCALRDLGSAAMPPAPDLEDAAYPAPEQLRPPYRQDARTDAYQVAALVYHTLTGHPPAPGVSPPVRASMPGFPAAADRALAEALDRDPERRPAMIGMLAAALRQAGRTLSGAVA